MGGGGGIIYLAPREKDLITFQHGGLLLFPRPPFPLTNNGAGAGGTGPREIICEVL